MRSSLTKQGQQRILIVRWCVTLQWNNEINFKLGTQGRWMLITVTSLMRLLSYSLSYSFLILPKSTSLRVTTMRIKVRSFVPAPLKAWCKRCAKYSALLSAHLTVRRQKLREEKSKHILNSITYSQKHLLLVTGKLRVHRVFQRMSG